MLVLMMLAPPSLAQERPAEPLSAVEWLIGGWTGVGEGQPGVSAAVRCARRVQGGRFLMVEGRSVYPKQEANKAGEVHTSVDFWSYDMARKRLVLRQFDSLGFVSTYVQDLRASTPRRFVLVSEALENVPPGWKARYTYEVLGPDEYHELFELDVDGKGLKTYVRGWFAADRTGPLGLAAAPCGASGAP
ncbi:MAG: hypothetical protein Q8Q88_23190 [Phenylobacterium sp.]|uniref:hypothetical protein n=1 Tax=Phenylobacterium sp. TaxID=1871053 RepID=UPI0027328D54|nr:hypothetical protein [Phenylobacterium sp.]MDP3749943.1 hypothetical protein [Phenylobacterium sp.]